MLRRTSVPAASVQTPPAPHCNSPPTYQCKASRQTPPGSLLHPAAAPAGNPPPAPASTHPQTATQTATLPHIAASAPEAALQTYPAYSLPATRSPQLHRSPEPSTRPPLPTASQSAHSPAPEHPADCSE